MKQIQDSNSADSAQKGRRQPATPWWKVRLMWLVVGGPLVVVIAASVTAVVAIRGQDPVLADRAMSAADLRVDSSKRADPAYQAAIEGRNHATTGGKGR